MAASRPPLTLAAIKAEARTFAQQLGQQQIPQLYGIDNGKTIGSEVEILFNQHLHQRFAYTPGNAASGLDFPDLNLEMKATSIRQPQSSCPFRDASQKIYGLGYHLLVMVYEKKDDPRARVARLDFKHVVFVDSSRTADFQTTSGLRDILARKGNKDDIIAFLEERMLPLDEIGREQLAERILKDPPGLGYLTISNALQWRLQYGRIIEFAAARQAGVEAL